MLNLRGVVVLLYLALGALAAAASAQTHDHSKIGATGPFYETWMQPDRRWVSCCHQEDCAPALKATQDPAGTWHAQRESDGEWFVIPADKVEQERDSPDGRSHLCVRHGHVLCFLPSGGT